MTNRRIVKSTAIAAVKEGRSREHINTHGEGKEPTSLAVEAGGEDRKLFKDWVKKNTRQHSI